MNAADVSNSILKRMRQKSIRTGLAIESGLRSLSGEELWCEVDALAALLNEQGIDRLAILGDNSLAWVLLDLACLQAGIICLPLPLFFSQQQLDHALSACGVDRIAVIGDVALAARLTRALPEYQLGDDITIYRCTETAPGAPGELPAATQKVTFTSGSTGAPKGVCLSVDNQLQVAQSLVKMVGVVPIRHLCLLPLSTLLENIGGVYVPLLSGGTVVVPDLQTVGLNGSSGLNPGDFLRAFSSCLPASVILLPQTLKLLVAACESDWKLPDSLRIMAVGGGTVAPQLMVRARELGLPVYQGYGLSECGSVVCLNLDTDAAPDSVGVPLEHVSLRLDDGEVCISGNTFLGYVGQPESWGQSEVRTGDLGIQDRQGRVYLRGRIKNIQVSAFGRNLDPEWVESELLSDSALAQAVVFTEARPYCVALLWPLDPATSAEEMEASVAAVNARLPDYARIHRWARLPQRLSAEDGLLTDNGRLRREAIYFHFQQALASMYEPNTESVEHEIF